MKSDLLYPSQTSHFVVINMSKKYIKNLSSLTVPPVTGKAAPEHKFHSVSSLFQPAIK